MFTKRNKYRNKRTNGFSSKAESNRNDELVLMEAAGVITDLKRQVKFDLQINCEHITSYIADFVYFEKGEKIVEDVKGFRTREYLIKKKLMKGIHGIEIKETGKTRKPSKGLCLKKLADQLRRNS